MEIVSDYEELVRRLNTWFGTDFAQHYRSELDGLGDLQRERKVFTAEGKSDLLDTKENTPFIIIDPTPENDP